MLYGNCAPSLNAFKNHLEKTWSHRHTCTYPLTLHINSWWIKEDRTCLHCALVFTTHLARLKVKKISLQDTWEKIYDMHFSKNIWHAVQKVDIVHLLAVAKPCLLTKVELYRFQNAGHISVHQKWIAALLTTQLLKEQHLAAVCSHCKVKFPAEVPSLVFSAQYIL